MSIMISFDSSARQGGHRVASSRGNGFLRRIVAGIGALLALALVGQRAAMAFGSPLLAVVVAGMLFLMAVAVHGAIGHGRR
jgi:hypothetical protein